jgi:hypothetical protein
MWWRRWERGVGVVVRWVAGVSLSRRWMVVGVGVRVEVVASSRQLLPSPPPEKDDFCQLSGVDISYASQFLGQPVDEVTRPFGFE